MSQNWAWKFSDEDILQIAKTTWIGVFANKQHMKFMAHITRMPNDAPQIMMCFAQGYGQLSHWSRLAKTAGIKAM